MPEQSSRINGFRNADYFAFAAGIYPHGRDGIQPGKYFGRKTSEPAEVTKYIHLYELVEHSSYAITIEDDKIILAGDIIRLAS